MKVKAPEASNSVRKICALLVHETIVDEEYNCIFPIAQFSALSFSSETRRNLLSTIFVLRRSYCDFLAEMKLCMAMIM